MSASFTWNRTRWYAAGSISPRVCLITVSYTCSEAMNARAGPGALERPFEDGRVEHPRGVDERVPAQAAGVPEDRADSSGTG
jgi:hypothetical protein